MKNFLFACVSALAVLDVALAENGVPASVCDANQCKIENNCRCSNDDSPLGGDLSEWPQLVSLTFDDAITQKVYNDYIEPLLMDPINPDGIGIGATFFVPHEFTNYQRVNGLYNLGFEIAVNSITKNNLQAYWRDASEETLVAEFQGQKQIISKFANIPAEQIVGVRTPQLQLSGNNTIKAYITAELSYDSSWPSLPSKRMYPYTLDYLSTEDCLLGAKCPNEAFPGFWILPINDFVGDESQECNVLAGCRVNGTTEEISNWLIDQIESVRNTSKTPMTLLLSSGWFNSTENSQAAFSRFIDTMLDKKDVFFVTQRQVLEFVKTPVKLVDFKTDSNDQVNCNLRTCSVKKDGEKDDRSFFVCSECPKVYPWLGNPNGDQE